jgi:phage regulator Rha-like protein
VDEKEVLMDEFINEMQKIRSQIYTIRGIKVMLDRDLAGLYGVEVRALNQSVKRNRERFPSDFMLKLSKSEFEEISKSQNVIMKHGQNLKYLPYAFTEMGVAMLSSVLKSKIAVEINIRIMRAFVEIRQISASTPEYHTLADALKKIEYRMEVIEANYLVDTTLVSAKTTQLSNQVRRLSETLDLFQDTHIIIKKPDEGICEG